MTAKLWHRGGACTKCHGHQTPAIRAQAEKRRGQGGRQCRPLLFGDIGEPHGGRDRDRRAGLEDQRAQPDPERFLGKARQVVAPGGHRMAEQLLEGGGERRPHHADRHDQLDRMPASGPEPDRRLGLEAVVDQDRDASARQLASRAATPGSVLPSSHSRNAPPAVDT